MKSNVLKELRKDIKENKQVNVTKKKQILKELLYNTGKSTQYFVMTCKGKESEKGTHI